MISFRNSVINIQLPLIPVFKDKMIFSVSIWKLSCSQGVWDLVESGYRTRALGYYYDNQEEQLKVNIDAKALIYIQ